jgi:putative hydrolase of the HAD superfamily
MKKIVLLLLMASSLIASPKALVFDFDGVMTREPPREAIYSFLEKTLHLSPPELDRVYEAIISGQIDRAFWQSLAKEKGVKLSGAWSNDFKAVMKDCLVNPEMFALVDRLKQKHLPIILFSNIDPIPAQYMREMGLFAPFDQHIFAYEIGAAKPDPKAYQIMIKQLNLPPQDIVFIDDRPENIRAAQALGINAILFQSADQIQQELQKAFWTIGQKPFIY